MTLSPVGRAEPYRLFTSRAEYRLAAGSRYGVAATRGARPRASGSSTRRARRPRRRDGPPSRGAARAIAQEALPREYRDLRARQRRDGRGAHASSRNRCRGRRTAQPAFSARSRARSSHRRGDREVRRVRRAAASRGRARAPVRAIKIPDLSGFPKSFGAFPELAEKLEIVRPETLGRARASTG